MFDDEDDDDVAGIGHNSHDVATDDRLRLFVERYENLEEEKKAISDDQKDVIQELKSVGYHPKIFREIVKIRKMNPDDRREHEAVLELYKAALGIV